MTLHTEKEISYTAYEPCYVGADYRTTYPARTRTRHHGRIGEEVTTSTSSLAILKTDSSYFAIGSIRDRSFMMEKMGT